MTMTMTTLACISRIANRRVASSSSSLVVVRNLHHRPAVTTTTNLTTRSLHNEPSNAAANNDHTMHGNHSSSRAPNYGIAVLSITSIEFRDIIDGRYRAQRSQRRLNRWDYMFYFLLYFSCGNNRQVRYHTS